MYALSLSSIPPRFAALGPVLDSLRAQDPAPARLLLCLPRSYRRFPGAVTPPALPDTVEILWSDTDLGPATKVLPAARALAGSGLRLIYCDDDWKMPPGWAAALIAGARPGEAATGAGYGVDRLGRRSTAAPPFADIAQGFSGVLVEPGWLASRDLDPPETAWPVDDIWLSGHLARQGIRIRIVPEARKGLIPALNDTHGLQDTAIDGRSRDAANRACCDLLFQRYGIWPPRRQKE